MVLSSPISQTTSPNPPFNILPGTSAPPSLISIRVSGHDNRISNMDDSGLVYNEGIGTRSTLPAEGNGHTWRDHGSC